MMRWTSLILLALLGSSSAFLAQGQVVSSPHSNYGGRDYSYFSIKITPEDVQRFSIVENPDGLSHQAFVTSQDNGQPFLLINAGISDQACQAMGYYVVQGQAVKPANTQQGNGNFYLKPNGAFLVTGNDVAVVESSALAAQTGVVYGIQSGPLLVDNKAINPAFSAASTNRHIRCGVVISTLGVDRYVNFVISNEPVSFAELATFFQEKLKCATALCLESAGCDMYFPERDVPYNAGGTTVCRYIKYSIE